jgi:hypothetical protein
MVVLVWAGGGCGRRERPVSCPDGTAYRRVKLEGAITAACMDAAQKLHGPVLSWHGRDEARRKLVGGYHHGLPHGRFEQFSREGASLGSYQMDRGTGVRVRWHENGNLAEKSAYRDGAADGPTTRWYEGGAKQEEGEYREGRKVGVWRSWDAAGQELPSEAHDQKGARLSSPPASPPPAPSAPDPAK